MSTKKRRCVHKDCKEAFETDEDDYDIFCKKHSYLLGAFRDLTSNGEVLVFDLLERVAELEEAADMQQSLIDKLIERSQVPADLEKTLTNLLQRLRIVEMQTKKSR